MKTFFNYFNYWFGFFLALLGFLIRVYSKGFDTLCLCFSLPVAVLTLVMAIILTYSHKTYT